MMPNAESIAAFSGPFDGLSNQALGVINDIVSDLIRDRGAQFLKATEIPVNGANHSVLVFKFDAAAFDAEFRAALRARGFELP